MVRLGVMWPGVFPERDKLNITYLKEADKIVNMLGKAGIFTMIDFHQDLLSAYFCGEGIPDWATTWHREGLRQFPLPIIKDNYTFDEKHHPNRSQCFEHVFSTHYMAD